MARQARVLAMANQKGGVAKTTSSLSLAAALHEKGQRVLVVDLDPQSNLSMSQGIDVENLTDGMYDVLVKALPIADIAKAAWLTDCARPCRQWALPFVRPLARLSVILVQVVKLVLPLKLQSSALLHWLIAKALARFVRKVAEVNQCSQVDIVAHSLGVTLAPRSRA